MAAQKTVLFWPKNRSQTVNRGFDNPMTTTQAANRLPGRGSEPHDNGLGMGGFTQAISSTKTRPSDTNGYVNGDGISESVSVGTVWTFSNVARFPKGSGIIQSALLLDTANQATKLQAELWLFTVAPTAVNDNVAWTPTNSELQYFIGNPLSFAVPYVASAGSGAAGNCVNATGSVNIPFVCAAADTNLYGILIARNSYTGTSAEQFTLILKVLQD